MGRPCAAAISADRRERLLKHNSPEIRRRAEANFQKMNGGDRMKVYQGLREIVNLPGEAKRGSEVFVRTCSACHTYAGAGGKVGPDLTGVRNQAAETLLLHIIVPNHEITPGYETVTVTTRDGTTIAGRIIAESDNGLTLRSAIDTEEVITRANIASFTASNVSLMPDGLEQTMTKGEVANLIAFLRQDFAPAETPR
jgi:putative heme-binding domain-containing protein